jgi:hypothetical protein
MSRLVSPKYIYIYFFLISSISATRHLEETDVGRTDRGPDDVYACRWMGTQQESNHILGEQGLGHTYALVSYET